MSRETSLMAHQQVKETLTVKQYLVWITIKELGVANCGMVSHVLGKPPNHYSGRFTDLKKLGRLEFVERKRCPIGNNFADFYRVCNPKPHFQEPTQLEMIL